MNSQRILYITTVDMFLNSGGGIATRAFYNALTNRYPNEVDVIHYDDGYCQNLPENFLSFGRVSNLRKAFNYLNGTLHRFKPRINMYLEKNLYKYRLVIINSGLFGDIVPLIKKSGTKLIVIHHNYEVDFQMDNKVASTLWGRFPYLVRKNEKVSYMLSDLNLFLTAHDKNTMEQFYGILPQGRNKVVGIFEPEQTRYEINKSHLNIAEIVISGSLNDVQTVKGLEDFLNNYKSTLDDYFYERYSLTITGRNPAQSVINRISNFKNYKIVPNPLNMQDTIKSFGLFINPVNCGSGLKLRLMDPLKLGIPILVNEVSSRGYEFFFDEEWFQIYNDKKTFEEGLIRISNYCSDRNDVRQLIQNKYIEFFSFQTGSQRFIDLINSFFEN